MLLCQVFIDVTGVPDLNVTTATSSGLTVGAAVSLQALIDLCVAQDPMSPSYTNDPTTETVTTATSSYSALARHLLKVAHHQVIHRRLKQYSTVFDDSLLLLFWNRSARLALGQAT